MSRDEQKINRATPGCLVILLDRSDSMKETTPAGASLAEGAADAVNRLLFDLAKRSQKERGAPPGHYFDIGVFGYGRVRRPGEAVEVAFQGALAGRPLVALPDLATNPIRVDRGATNDDLPTRLPIWVDPVHGTARRCARRWRPPATTWPSGSSSTANSFPPSC